MRLHRDLPTLALFAGLLTTTPTTAQDITWALRAPANVPQARIQHVMCYDSVRQRVLMYGGYGGAGLSDTWEWDGSNWLLRSNLSAPQIRRWSTMNFDASRGVAVLFGGQSNSGSHPNDTWEWNGTSWSSIPTTNAPSPRAFHAMCYDSQRQRIVLFGGRDRQTLSSAILNDLWEYDGIDWTQRNIPNQPPGRVEHTMVYDPVRGRAVVWNGRITNTTYANDLWEFDGNAWHQMSPSTMPPHGIGTYQSAAFDASRGAIVAFDGYSQTTGYLNATWAWDGTDWTQLTVGMSPAARGFATLAYDEARQSLVAFGGGTVQGSRNETYTSFYPAAASTFGNGCGSPALALSPDPAGRPILGQSGRLTIDNVPGPIVAVAA
ncbi:MAG: hypothetical protein RL398_215, partial [Planctomycetota bacterium]